VRRNLARTGRDENGEERPPVPTLEEYFLK